MKKFPTIFLQAVVVLISISTFVFMLWEPHFEDRNVSATFFEIYFDDPFLAYAYTASIAFFTALYQAFKVLGYVRRDKTFSQKTVKAMRTIKYCAIAMIGFIVAPVAYLFIVRPGDDIAGGVFMGLLILLGSSIAAATATMFERILQNAVELNLTAPNNYSYK